MDVTGNNIRDEAARGLHHSTRRYLRFWRTRELRTQAAELSLAEVDRLALGGGDVGAHHAVTVGQIAARGAATPKQRLAALQQTLSAVQSGVAGGINVMAGLALRLGDAAGVDGATSRQLFATVHACAKAESAPQSQYLEGLSTLMEHGADPRMTLVAATTEDRSAQAYARAGLRLSQDASTPIPVAAAATDSLQVLAQQEGNQRILDHLDRLRQSSALPLSEPTRHILRRMTLDEVSQGTPPRHLAVWASDAVRQLPNGSADQEPLLALGWSVAPPPWQNFLRKMEALTPPASVPPLRAAALEGLRTTLESNTPELVAQAAAARTIVSQQKPDAAGARMASDVLDLLAAQDKAEGSKHAADFAAFRTIESKVAGDEAKFRVLLAAIGRTGREDGGGLSGLALEVLGQLPPTARAAFGSAVLAEADKQMRTAGDTSAADMARATSIAVATPMADAAQNEKVLRAALGALAKPLHTLNDCAMAARTSIAAADNIVDRAQVQEPFADALHAIAARGNDAAAIAKTALLRQVAHTPLSDRGAQASAFYYGINGLVDNANLAGIGYQMARNCKWQDATPIATMTVAALRTQAAAAHDESVLEEVGLLEAAAALHGTRPDTVSQTLLYGLSWMANPPAANNGDPLLALSRNLMSHSLPPPEQSSLAAAALTALEARGARLNQPSMQAAAHFGGTLSAIPFASDQSRSQMLTAAVNHMSNLAGSPLSIVTRMANNVVGYSGFADDKLRVMRCALEHAEPLAADADRRTFVQALRAAADVPNGEISRQANVASAAVNALVGFEQKKDPLTLQDYARAANALTDQTASGTPERLAVQTLMCQALNTIAERAADETVKGRTRLLTAVAALPARQPGEHSNALYNAIASVGQTPAAAGWDLARLGATLAGYNPYNNSQRNPYDSQAIVRETARALVADARAHGDVDRLELADFMLRASRVQGSDDGTLSRALVTGLQSLAAAPAADRDPFLQTAWRTVSQTSNGAQQFAMARHALAVAQTRFRRLRTAPAAAPPPQPAAPGAVAVPPPNPLAAAAGLDFAARLCKAPFTSAANRSQALAKALEQMAGVALTQQNPRTPAEQMLNTALILAQSCNLPQDSALVLHTALAAADPLLTDVNAKRFLHGLGNALDALPNQSQTSDPARAAVTEMLRILQRKDAAPTFTDYAYAADRVANSASYSNSRLPMQRALCEAVVAITDASGDEPAKQKARLLNSIAALDLQETDAHAATLSRGLQILQPSARNQSLAYFASYVVNNGVSRSPAETTAVTRVALTAIRDGSTVDADVQESAAMLLRVCNGGAAEDSSRAAITTAGLGMLAEGAVGADRMPYIARRLREGQTNGNTIVTPALLDALEARGNGGLTCNLRFIRRLGTLPLSEPARIESYALNALAKSPPQGWEGLSRIASEAVSNAGTTADALIVLRCAFDEICEDARGRGNGDALIFASTMRKLASLNAYSDNTQMQVARTALQSLGTVPSMEPGELAECGLAMFRNVDTAAQLQIGEVLLAGMEEMAAHQNDKVFVPVVVGDLRDRLRAKPNAGRRAEILRQGLGEVAKMKGDIYRKALLNALQGEPEDAPTIDNEKEYVVIGGVKVNKKKASANTAPPAD